MDFTLLLSSECTTSNHHKSGLTSKVVLLSKADWINSTIVLLHLYIIQVDMSFSLLVFGKSEK